MQLVIAEKPNAARLIAAVVGATDRKDGYLTGGGFAASWCVGHPVDMRPPDPSETSEPPPCLLHMLV